MDVIEAINTRRSVRKYLDKPVAKEIIEQLVDAAVKAPNAMNAQPWAFGVIQDREKLREFSDRAKKQLLAHLHLYPVMEKYREMLSDPNYNLFYEAPALVIIYSRPERSPAGAIDCALAAENLMLAARSLGLGTCWIGFATGFFRSPEVKEELGVPTAYEAMAQIIVGYPDGEMPVPEREKPEIMFWK